MRSYSGTAPPLTGDAERASPRYSRAHIIGRLASLGLIAILILLPGLAFWAAVATYQAGVKAQQAIQIQNAFEAARFAVGEEESLERKYRLQPNKEVRAEHAAAGLSMVTSLQRAVRLGSDRSFLDDVLVLHTRYLAAVASMFEMIDAGDTRRADEIDVNEADPSFDSIETRVSVAADEREANALRQFAQLGSIQTKVLFATPIVFVLGLSLVAFFSGVLRSYRRGAAEAMRREATATGDRERRFRSLIQNTSDVIVICTAAGTVTYQSPAAEAGWGFATDELLDQAFLTLLHPDGRPALRELWELLQSDAEPFASKSRSIELQLRDGAREWRHVELMLANLLHEPAIAGVVVTIRDIQERKAFELQLTHQAFYDSLTGLPNRLLLRDRLSQALARAGRRGSQVALLFLDLDNFKLINDSLGHQIGDELLVEAAARLKSCVRTEDTVARLGSDEFVIVLEHPTSEADAVSVAEAIASRFGRVFALGGRELSVTVSTGIALGEPDANRADDLVHNADVAMYRAKSGGKARHIVFDPAMHVDSLDRLELESDLRRAIDHGELRVHYQPIVFMRSGVIGEFEALVRWQHPKRGLVSPGEFIPIAEESGLILPIGQWVLEQACQQMAAWHAEFPFDPPLRLSVNLSPRQFQQPALVDEVARAVREAGLPPDCLKLEITEGVIMRDVEATIDTLSRLKDSGIKLAIDDFGTGYSSLSYLKRLPLDVLKIDRSFVAGIGRDSDDTAIVRAIISLAKSLELEVTGEGIETPEHAALLTALGCDLGQGYYYGKPIDGADTTAMLHTIAHHKPQPRAA
jgi:diguanylate cyclase (GGDEF)-like protein/PAS domain S-box-containing protein